MGALIPRPPGWYNNLTDYEKNKGVTLCRKQHLEETFKV